jgi:hypothetical protein
MRPLGTRLQKEMPLKNKRLKNKNLKQIKIKGPTTLRSWAIKAAKPVFF